VTVLFPDRGSLGCSVCGQSHVSFSHQLLLGFAACIGGMHARHPSPARARVASLLACAVL
jgi:hypothetical protein